MNTEFGHGWCWIGKEFFDTNCDGICHRVKATIAFALDSGFKMTLNEDASSSPAKADRAANKIEHEVVRHAEERDIKSSIVAVTGASTEQKAHIDLEHAVAHIRVWQLVHCWLP